MQPRKKWGEVEMLAKCEKTMKTSKTLKVLLLSAFNEKIINCWLYTLRVGCRKNEWSCLLKYSKLNFSRVCFIKKIIIWMISLENIRIFNKILKRTFTAYQKLLLCIVYPHQKSSFFFNLENKRINCLLKQKTFHQRSKRG